MNWKRGDILEGENRDRNAAFHYIVFLDDNNSGDFIGGVLTTKGSYENNVLMLEGHFKSNDENGDAYKVSFNNSYLVKGKFIKLESWGRFKKVGCLTTEGVEFVDNETREFQPELWEVYLRRQNQTPPIQ